MREFLYLNSNLVDQFLAQEEDGLYDEESEKERHTGERKGGGTVGASAIKLEGSLGATKETELLRTRRQTPESRFNRLAQIASAMPNSRHLKIDSEENPAIYASLEAGKLITASCYVDIPSFGRVLAQPEQVKSLFELMNMFAPGGASDSDREALDGLTQIAGNMSDSIICTGEIEDNLPKLVFKLSRSHLRSEIGDLEGEAIIFGNIHRKWTEGQRFPLLAVPGLDMMSRADRRRMQATSRSEEPNEMMIEGPGATVSVVAIYRGAF